MNTTTRGRCRKSSLVAPSHLVALVLAFTCVLGCGSSKPQGGDGAAGHAGADGGAKAGSTGTSGAGGSSGTGGGGSAAGTGGGGNVAGTGGGAGADGGAPDGDASTTGDAPDEVPPLKVDGPWLVRDIGDLGPGTARGSLAASSSVFTVRGTGAGVTGAADAFFFAYQHVTGDGEIVARVESLLKVSATAQVGVMVRADDADPGAANVFLALDGDGSGGQLRSRPSKGAAETATANATLREGRLLRLARTGKVVTAFRDDGAGGWTTVGAIELELPNDVVIGLAVTDGAAGSVASAAFDVARIASLDADAATKGYVLSELGTMGGSALVSGGVLTLAGLGERTSVTSDVGVFFQQSNSGAHTITARVAELTGPAADTRVGLMVREGAPNAPVADPAYAFMSITKSQGVQFGNRSKPGGNAQAGVSTLGVTAPVWLRLEKVDAIDGTTSTFTGFSSADGKTWNVLDSLTFPLQQPYSMGVFLLSGSVTTFSGARLTDISVTSPK